MKVSICTITYNQEAYIREAIDSFLSQQTSFDFEIDNFITHRKLYFRFLSFFISHFVW